MLPENKPHEEKKKEEYTSSGEPANTTWPCHIVIEPATKSEGVTHQQPYYGWKKFPLFFFFFYNQPPPAAFQFPPTPPHLNLSSAT